MFRKVLTYVVLVPVAIIILMFAVANRQVVTVSFDPFSFTDPAFAMRMPLFALIFVLVILGIIIGGVAAWLKQGKWRKNARRLETDIAALRSEVALLNAHLDARGSSAALPPPESGAIHRPPAA